MASLIEQLDIDVPIYVYEKYNAEWKDAQKRWAREFRAKSPGELVGEIVTWPVADGYAEYMVASEKPLKLAHINILDGYVIPHAMIRGLRLSDIRSIVDHDRFMRKMFAKSK